MKTSAGVIRECAVSSVTPHKNIFLMHVEGLNAADEAEEYRGAEIFIKKKPLNRKDDEYYWHELLGLEVCLDTGECLGTISRIVPTGGNDIYVVRKGGKEVYIPAVYEVVKEIDLEKGKMTISPLEGMLDLNEV